MSHEVTVRRVVTSGTFSLDGETFGDTQFRGGPGASGRSCSDRPTIEASLRNRPLTLAGGTVVRTGHGEDTTVEAERPHIPTP